jgi:PAT family beta-lactamase induction signal transducer AmpG
MPTGFTVHNMGLAVFRAVSVAGAPPGILLLPRFAPWRERNGKNIDTSESFG